MTEGLLLKNGWVIDPETEKTIKKDVLIIDGKFIQLESDKTATVMELDVTGCYVAPGFIDMHVHVFEAETTLGINPDLVGINQGVTTIVDAGSSGVNDFPTFKTKIIDQNQTEVLAFLNISRNGLCSGLSELANMNDLMTVDELQELLKMQTDIVGLKARMSHSVVKDNGVKPLEYARRLADLSQLPIMVHIGNAPPELIEILPLLQKEDIVTHAFHGKKGGILSNEGKLIDAAHDAIKRGVLFDVGHGTSSFSFQTMKTYKKNYPYPFTTSTDIYLGNYDKPVGSLMTTMSKLLALGYSLEELVASVTARPKKALRLSEQGCFTPGTRADVTIFKLIDKREILIDSQGEGMEVSKMLVPHITIRQGRVVYKAK
ncbi:amidohydrolase/deacetylase family metallohydrolase [Heyndrickxia sp. FSL W8-0496]|uniref:amidohydrolase/deacetylase family metallohydrolase n=1 Tax=Heyndrickxia sp. FSL W8-0496 TaxID=2954702 RepID=UPI0030FAFDD2